MPFWRDRDGVNIPVGEAVALQNARVLNRRESKLKAVSMLQKPIRRLRAARGKRHSLWHHLKNLGYGLPGVLDNCSRLASFRVKGEWVSGAIEGVDHGLPRFGSKRRCGVVIEIASDAHEPTFAAAASSLNEKRAAGIE